MNGEMKSKSPRRCRTAFRFRSANEDLSILLYLVPFHPMRIAGDVCAVKYTMVRPITPTGFQPGRRV